MSQLRRRSALAALLIGTLALGACGGGSDAATSGSDKPTITVAYQKFPGGDLIVKHDQLLEKALPDYNIEWKSFDSGASVNTAFVAGAVDIGAIGSSPVARGLSDPLNIPYKVAYILDVSGANEALVARNDSGVTSVEDLRGRRVGTPFASTSHYSLLAALDSAGLSDKDVTLVDLQPQDIVAAWKRGDIDAAYVWLPTLDDLKGDGTVLIDSEEIASQGKPTLNLGVVSEELIAEHPDVVTAWRKAQADAARQIHADLDASAESIAPELNLTPEETKAQLQQGIYLTPEEAASPTWLGTDGKPGGLAANLHDAAQFLVDQKKIPTAPSTEQIGEAIYTEGLPDAIK